jgi:hypothetical protein
LPPKRTEYAAAIQALAAAAAAFDRAKRLGLVTLDDQGRLFCADVGRPALPKNADQLRLC